MAETVYVRQNLAPDIARLMRAVDPEPVWHEQGNRKVSRLVRGLRTGGEPASGMPPVSRHGGAGFAGRFSYRVADDGRTLIYGNASVQARILALGGRIPESGEASPKLTIPVRQGMKGPGGITLPAAVEAEGKRARDFPDIFRLGRFLVVGKKRGRGREAYTELKFLFMLCGHVVIKPHPYGMEWDDVDNAALRASLTRRIAKAEQERKASG